MDRRNRPDGAKLFRLSLRHSMAVAATGGRLAAATAHKGEGDFMQKQICATLTKSVLMIAPALGMSAVSASAQSYEHITAKIPFDFTVGAKTLPACAHTV